MIAANIVGRTSNTTMILYLVSARVSVTQVYKNQSNLPTSRAKYMFPVPPRAAVCAFSMTRQDQHIIYGVAKENSKAVEEYEAEIRGDSTAVEWVSDDG
jgi:Vault protein inter-alpha-trypsin domain